MKKIIILSLFVAALASRVLSQSFTINPRVISTGGFLSNSIIEVKTRSSNAYGEPSIFVTKKKKKMMIQAAEWYCELYQLSNVDFSFDIISIVLRNDGTYNIEFIENAFYPTI
jgi:hypothetical protein